jgi:hypothetical protein
MLGGTPIRLLTTIVAAMFVAGALFLGSGVSARTIQMSAKSPTLRCSQSDAPLAAAAPGSQAFEALAKTSLTDGCVAYVETSASTSLLDLEFLRGPMTGMAITIGPIVTTSGGVNLVDLALTSSGTLYGIDGSALYTIDPATAHATFVGPLGSSATGLVSGPTGTIYASGANELFTVDTITGAGTTVGTTGFNSAGDVAFSQNGTLFMTASRGSPSDLLVRLNPTSGTGTLVGSTGQCCVWGLAFSYGTLFGATAGGNLLALNTSTGVGTVLAYGGPSANGMAASPATVAPAGSGSATTPKIVIDSDVVAPTGKPLAAPVSLTCAKAACSGSIELTAEVNLQKAGQTASAKPTNAVIGRATYKLAKGMRRRFSLPLTTLGIAMTNEVSQHPVQTMLVVSVKGGAYATRGLVIQTAAAADLLAVVKLVYPESFSLDGSATCSIREQWTSTLARCPFTARLRSALLATIAGFVGHAGAYNVFWGGQNTPGDVLPTYLVTPDRSGGGTVVVDKNGDFDLKVQVTVISQGGRLLIDDIAYCTGGNDVYGQPATC